MGRELKERAKLVQVEPLAPLWQSLCLSLCLAGHKGMWQSKGCGHRLQPCMPPARRMGWPSRLCVTMVAESCRVDICGAYSSPSGGANELK